MDIDLIDNISPEDDLLSSLLGIQKDDFSPIPNCYPNPKSASDLDSLLPFGESKVGREGGNPEEDEGFEDFVEEEIIDALQKDSDPTLADTHPLDCKRDSLDLLFPMTVNDSDTDELKKPLLSISITDEILDFDQGVAMESDNQPRPSSESYDLPFTSLTPTVSMASSPFPFNNTQIVPSLSPSTIYSTSTYVDSSSTPLNLVTPPSIIPPSTLSTERQNSELDFICSVLQSDSEQQGHQSHNNTTVHHPAVSIAPAANICIDTLDGMEMLNLLNSSVPDETAFTGVGTGMSTASLSNLVFGTESVSCPMMSSTDCITSVQLTDVPTITNHTNNVHHSGYTNSASCTDSSSRRSPTPSLLAPSPVSSVTTDFSDTDSRIDFVSMSGLSSEMEPPNKKFVNMPFYEFKKILDLPTLSERDKEEVKAIRKRGKNKVAAKHCRQRKLEVIMGLQQEVERLRGYKAQLMVKELALVRNIHETKQRVSKHYKNTNNTLLATQALVH